MEHDGLIDIVNGGLEPLGRIAISSGMGRDLRGCRLSTHLNTSSAIWRTVVGPGWDNLGHEENERSDSARGSGHAAEGNTGLAHAKHDPESAGDRDGPREHRRGRGRPRRGHQRTGDAREVRPSGTQRAREGRSLTLRGHGSDPPSTQDYAPRERPQVPPRECPDPARGWSSGHDPGLPSLRRGFDSRPTHGRTSRCESPRKNRWTGGVVEATLLRRSGMDGLSVTRRRRTRRTRGSIRTTRRRPASCGLLPRTSRSPGP